MFNSGPQHDTHCNHHHTINLITAHPSSMSPTSTIPASVTDHNAGTTRNWGSGRRCGRAAPSWPGAVTNVVLTLRMLRACPGICS